MENLRSESEIINTWIGCADEPFLSICCITFNHEEYIEDALKGFLIQETTYPFEVIVHDDASTDSTVEIINKYHLQYPRIIKPIYQKENQYSKGLRITPLMLPRCKGKYIAYCEGDDYWISPKKLQSQINFLEKNPNVNICFHSSYTLLDEGLCDLKYGFYGNKEKVINAKLVIKSSSGFMPLATVIVRKKVILTAYLSDKDFFSKNMWHSTIQILGSSIGGAGYIPQYYAVYRSMHQGSWSYKNATNIEMRVDNFTSFLYRNRKLKRMSPKGLGGSFNYALARRIMRFIIKEDIKIIRKINILRAAFISAHTK